MARKKQAYRKPPVRSAQPQAQPTEERVRRENPDAITVDGRVIPYHDFEVWRLPGASAPESTAAPEPTAAPEATLPPAPAPTVSPDDAAAFAMILASQSQAAPLAGPFNANLLEEDGRIALSWADVDLADFHAQATFDVPENASDVLWDIGFMFRSSSAGTIRVVVDSAGS